MSPEFSESNNDNSINRAESTQKDEAVVAEMRAREAGQRARLESVRKHSAAEQKNIKAQIQKRLEQAKRELLRIEREGKIMRDINESAIWMALKKLDWSLGEENVKCTDEDDNEVAKFLKIERERNETQEEVIEVEMCEEFEKNEIEREKYDEQRYCEYITEEDNRWLLQSVEEIEHQGTERKFMNDTIKRLSLGGTVVVTKITSDDELDEIEAFEERKQIHEEEMCVQYLIDEDDRFLYDTVAEFEEKEGVKFLKESVDKFSENAPEDDMDLECPEDEFDEIRRGQEEFALQTQAENFIQLEKEEEMHVQIIAMEYDLDEDEGERAYSYNAHRFECVT